MNSNNNNQWICNRCGQSNTGNYCTDCGKRKPGTNHSLLIVGIIGILVSVLFLTVVMLFGIRQKKGTGTTPEEHHIEMTTPEPTIPVFTPAAAPTPTPALPLSYEALDKVNLEDYQKVYFENAYASSELGNHYIAENAIDGTEKTSWQEAEKGYGIGAYLYLEFPGYQTVDMIAIWPGYSTAFIENGKPKELLIVFHDGTSCYITLENQNKMQYFRLSRPVDTYCMTVYVVSVYESTIDQEDTCISEIEAYRK